MGTSKGYSAPTGGAWTKLKRDVSLFARGDSPPPPTPDPRIASFLAQLIAALGGSAAIAHAGARGTAAGAGVGGEPAVGASAARTGAALGGFATAVGETGMDAALERFDLADYADRAADEVVDALVERLADVPMGLDDAAAQEALTLLLNELRGDAATKQDLEIAYRNAVQTLGVRGLMVRYFGYYLYMLWCRTFIERMNRDPDRPNLAATKSAQVREFILNETAARIGEAELDATDWTSPEGLVMAAAVLEETFTVFESAG